MKFNELNEKDKEKFIQIYWDKSKKWLDRLDELQKLYETSERTIRKWSKIIDPKSNGSKSSKQYLEASNRKLSKKQVYLFSWAQNATPIHEKMWKNLRAYADYLDADIHIIAGRYKNPTSSFTSEQKNLEYWDKNLAPYLDANRHKIHEELTILSDLKIQPTAIYPLFGLEGLSKGGSIIVGSPKIHMQPFPVLKGDNCKFAFTTGSITKPNYTDSKSGKRGEFFHMYGFAIVELDKEEFYIRQVPVEEDGSFIDLNVQVKNGKIEDIKSCEAIVLGDAHQSEVDSVISEKTLSLLKTIKPKHTIFHDLFNGKSISHHEKKDPIILYEKYLKKEDVLETELENMLSWLKKWLDYNPVIVSSNHNDWLDRYIINQDWKGDIKNSLIYSKLLTIALEGKSKKGLVAYLIENRYKDKVKCLARDESFKIKGYELSYHGDQGQNGSKGSLKQFAKLNTKVVVGDYHSGARIDGALSVGVMTPLRLNYNKGASSWNNSHVIIHNNGKAQHIIFKSNKKFSTRYD